MIFLLAGLLAGHCAAELRDPTRPSGYALPAPSATDISGEAPLVLQAVFYSPAVSGVLINGRRYHAGDTVRDARILTIGVDHVVLSTPDGEQELTLTVPAVKQPHGENLSNESKGRP